MIDAATALRQRFTPAPSSCGIFSTRCRSSCLRWRSSSGAAVDAAACATAEVILPAASARSIPGMEVTRRREVAMVLFATEGERRVARETSCAVFASDCVMSCSRGGRKSSSWAASFCAAWTASRVVTSARATIVRTSSTSSALRAAWTMSSRFLYSARARPCGLNMAFGAVATSESRWSTSPSSSASADGPLARSAARVSCAGGCASDGVRGVEVTMDQDSPIQHPYRKPLRKMWTARAASTLSSTLPFFAQAIREQRIDPAHRRENA